MNKILISASMKTRLILDFLATEGRTDEILGIVDKDASRQGTEYYGKSVLGDLDSVLKSKNCRHYFYCVCLSERYFSERIKIQEYLENLNCNITSIISENVFISRSARIKPGSIIFPGVSINASACIGKCVTIYSDALIEHDCVIQDNVEISPKVAIAGGVTVDRNTFIGINVTILPNLTIGSNVLIGAGSVIIRNVPSNSVVVGNPGRIIREHF